MEKEETGKRRKEEKKRRRKGKQLRKWRGEVE
jgi:hypothetical protein